jgi:hypothetical protein
MDIEATADHLRQLGCTQTQIDNHLKALRCIAAAKRPPKREPKLKPRPPPFTLSQSEIDTLLAQLRERQWRWSIWRRRSDDWVGDLVLSVTGTPALKSHVGPRVNAVLTHLQKLGLIKKVSNGCAGEDLAFFVQVVEQQPTRPHRERLEQSTVSRVRKSVNADALTEKRIEPAKERASTGKTGSGHAATAATRDAKTQASSASLLSV